MPFVWRQIWVSDEEIADQQAAERRGEMNAADACRLLDCSRSRLNALALSGVIRHDHRLGRTWYDMQDVRELAGGGCPSDRHRREAAEAAADFEAYLGPRAAKPAEPPARGPEGPANTFLGNMNGGGR